MSCISTNTNYVLISKNSSNNLTINYPVRIHSTKNCTCVRIKSNISMVRMEINEKIVFVVEKLFHDEKYKNCPSMVYVTKDNDDNDFEAATALVFLFKTCVDMRKK